MKKVIILILVGILAMSACVEENRTLSTPQGSVIPITSNRTLILDIAKQVAKSHNYTLSFRCVEFSNVLVGELGKAGFDAEVIIGYKDQERHAWVELESPEMKIEATTGERIPQHEYVVHYSLEEPVTTTFYDYGEQGSDYDPYWDDCLYEEDCF